MFSKIVFIGNRAGILKELLSLWSGKIIIYALHSSPLEADLKEMNIQYYQFDSTKSGKVKLIESIKSEDCDLLISNGCPFLLPKMAKIMVNIHPSYLPQLRGKHPVNGALYENVKFLGATMHYMEEKADSGRIIFKKKVRITKDLDLQLSYLIAFELEKDVFKCGWKKLMDSNFSTKGSFNNHELSTYFTRSESLMNVNFELDNTEFILRKIRAFGIKSQGCRVLGLKKNNTQVNIIYSAWRITNAYLLKMFESAESGSICHNSKNTLLIKTIDGLICCSSYE